MKIVLYAENYVFFEIKDKGEAKLIYFEIKFLME